MHVTVTPALAALLAEKRIFSGLRAPRFVAGEPLAFHEDCALEPYAQVLAGHILPLAMGAFSYAHSELELNVGIGRYASIGKGVTWMGAGHPTDWVSASPAFYDETLPGPRHFRDAYGVSDPLWPFDSSVAVVNVGHDAWIGDGAMIAPGVTIGPGAVVGARSLVLEDVPPYAIVVGSPARLLRYRLAEDLIPRFLEAQWWRYAPNVLQPLPMTDPERFLDALAEARAKKPQILKPTPLTGAEIAAAAQA